MKSILPFFRNHATAVLLLGCSFSLFSCSKEIIPETNIGEVVNLAVVSSFRTQLTKATTLEELPVQVKSAAEAIPQVLSPSEIALYSTADLPSEVEALKTAMTLSNEEIIALKANNPNAYNVVVTRLSNIVSFASESDLWKHHAVMVTNAIFDPFLASRAYSMETIYQNNDYQAVLDLRKVLDAYMVQMIQKVQDLKNNTTKSANMPLNDAIVDRNQQIATLVALILDQAHCIIQPYRDKISDNFKVAKGN
jgi:hypothetical protein